MRKYKDFPKDEFIDGKNSLSLSPSFLVNNPPLPFAKVYFRSNCDYSSPRFPRVLKTIYTRMESTCFGFFALYYRYNLRENSFFLCLGINMQYHREHFLGFFALFYRSNLRGKSLFGMFGGRRICQKGVGEEIYINPLI